MAVPLTGISNLTIRDRLLRRAFHTSGFNSPFSAQCSIAGQSRLGNSARDEMYLDSTECFSWLAFFGDNGKPTLSVVKLPKRRQRRALGRNETKVLEHHGCHPNRDKCVNIAYLELDMSVFAFYVVVLRMHRTKPMGARSLLDSRSMVRAWCESIQIERNQKSFVCKNMKSGSFVRVSSFAGSMLATIHSLKTWTRCSRMRPLFLLIVRAAGSASKVRKRSFRYRNRRQET